KLVLENFLGDFRRINQETTFYMRKKMEADVEATREELAAFAGLEVEELLEGLTDNQRRAVVLAKMEGRPLAEVGARLGLSLSAVKVTIHRALGALRRKAKKDDDEYR
ncbi:MAG TPA: sigma factor-like helix-turn-helix DNA-binding protein, partial [Elusimicrobiota bacterium]|nr:sigma factor-like helix-turn-helix DNA-binding protein [Elusimicrobiota bacterium]